MYLLWHRLQDATRRACRRPYRHQPSDLLQLVCSACAHPARKARVSAWLQVKTLMTTPPNPLSPPCGLEEGVKGSTTLPALNWSPGTSTEKRSFIPVTDAPWMSEVFKKRMIHNSSKENASYATLYLNNKLFRPFDGTDQSIGGPRFSGSHSKVANRQGYIISHKEKGKSNNWLSDAF